MAVQENRILGIDFGLARLGLALSDPGKIISFPLHVFPAEKKSEQTVKKLIAFIEATAKDKKCTIEMIVVGMPFMMSGKKGLLADEVDHFVSVLRNFTAIPIVTWDERLTTVMAERSLRESSLTRKRRAQVVDAVSAGIMLQNFLDSKRV